MISAAGELPSVVIHRRRLIDERDLVIFIDRQKTSAAGVPAGMRNAAVPTTAAFMEVRCDSTDPQLQR